MAVRPRLHHTDIDLAPDIQQLQTSDLALKNGTAGEASQTAPLHNWKALMIAGGTWP